MYFCVVCVTTVFLSLMYIINVIINILSCIHSTCDDTHFISLLSFTIDILDGLEEQQ